MYASALSGKLSISSSSVLSLKAQRASPLIGFGGIVTLELLCILGSINLESLEIPNLL